MGSRDRVRATAFHPEAVREGPVRRRSSRPSSSGEAGLPDGVFNVVHGDKVAVDAILEHPGIGAVSFVGSTPIARYIYETGTKHGKRVQALGGAKNHMIVLPDADVEMAADAAVSAGYGSAGERCMAVSVLVAVGDVADPLVEAIKQRLPNVKVGDGMQPENEMGAADHTRASRQGRVLPRVWLRARGDARRRPPRRRRTGRLLPRRVAARHVTTEMDAYRDEIFGPVLSVVRADTYDEAVGLVNDNPYGNGVALFTRDGGAAAPFQFDVNAGMVGINVPIPVPVAYYSFGGWKASLFGDSHAYGPRVDPLLHAWEGRHVSLAGPSTSKVDLGFPQTR